MAPSHAVDSVVPEGGPVIPFAIVENGQGQRALNRFAGELSAAQEHARQEVRRASDVVRAAIAWDGYLTLDGQRQGHPPAQARLADPQIGRDLRDRLLTRTGQVHCSTPELRRLGCRHPGLLSRGDHRLRFGVRESGAGSPFGTRAA
jgi:hypothetical protein